MSHCLNPDCQKPQNLDGVRFCLNCGAKLLLKDRYRAIQQIGQGGFGRTFLAIDEDKPSRPYCVIKQFFPEVKNSSSLQKAAELFEQEAERLEELGKHAQVPELLAHFTQDQRQYLIQEFIEGRNLASLLEDGAFTEAQVRGVLNSLLPVLEFIHARRVIHRDIKPENIIARVASRSSSPSFANQPDWNALLQALTSESEQGFKDGVVWQYRFSEWVSASLSQVLPDMTIAHAHRWQQMASHFGNYPRLPFQQRQYLVADAYRFLHEMRRIYEVIEVIETEQLVLVDFGAAKRATGTALMRTGTSIGTPEYIAPEQARGKAVFASDLYSLGVTCLHLLTGVSPFDLFDTHEDVWIWRQYLSAPVSEEFGKVLDKLVEQATSRRYQSATDVLQDLNGAPRSSIAAVSLPSVTPASVPKVRPSFTINRKQANAKKPDSSNPTKLQPRSKSQQWQCIRQIKGLGKVHTIALSPDGQILASNVGNNIQLWDLQTGQPLRKLAGHFDVVHAIAISPNGQILASGGFDKTIRLWNLHTGQRLGVLSLHTDTVLAIVFSPDGKLVASSSLHDPIKLWDIQYGQEKVNLNAHTGRIDALAFSPDGNLLASGSADTSIKLWDVATGQELRTLVGHSQLVSAIAFTPDGKTLISSSWDGTTKFWSLRTRKEKRSLMGHSDRVSACTVTEDGKTIATAGEDIKLWNNRSGKEIETLEGHTSLISALAFTPNGKVLISGSWDGTIAIWEQI